MLTWWGKLLGLKTEVGPDPEGLYQMPRVLGKAAG